MGPSLFLAPHSTWCCPFQSLSNLCAVPVGLLAHVLKQPPPAALCAARLPVQCHLPEPILGLAWVGPSLFIAIPGGYKLLRGTTLIALCDHLDASLTPLVAPLPSAGLGLLLWDVGLGLVVGPEGGAVREPLLLPGRPLALVAAGLFVAAVCEDGVHVYDRNTSREVQVRGGGEGWRLEEGQQGVAGANNNSGSC